MRVVPRPPTPPVFDCLRYAKLLLSCQILVVYIEGLGTRLYACSYSSLILC